MLTILKRLKQIVGAQLLINPEKINLQANFLKDLGADSMDVIEIILNIEYEFDISIEDKKVKDIQSIADVINYMKLEKIN